MPRKATLKRRRSSRGAAAEDEDPAAAAAAAPETAAAAAAAAAAAPGAAKGGEEGDGPNKAPKTAAGATPGAATTSRGEKQNKTKGASHKTPKKSGGGGNRQTDKKHKKSQKRVVWHPEVDGYDYDKPLPVGCDTLCLRTDGLVHKCRVLEAKKLADIGDMRVEKISAGVPPLALVNGKDRAHEYIYYVHYAEYNRRMDEWVYRDRMCFVQDLSSLEASPDKAVAEEVGRHLAHIKRSKELHEDHGDFDEESLKAHEEVTKVKNVNVITVGPHRMETWYFSPFPAEYKPFDELYFCEFCLNFYGHPSELHRHMRKCKLRHPPGNEIYRSKEQNVTIAMWEVDGMKERIYCQNLCYIAKVFLDHKTLHYDTDPFLFYILTEVDEFGYHLVGYFSKEKHSEEGYNVACILTLPCHQRKGYGRFLISLSYELSKIERKVGSPEKPLSDLGAVSYRSYWASVLLDLLAERKEDVSIKDLSRITCITTEDVLGTLRHLGVIRYTNGEHVIHVPPSMLAKHEAQKRRRLADPTRVRVADCDPGKLHWTPFNPSNKRNRFTM